MILFVYNVALLFALVLSAPWWLFRMATTHKYREGLPERLGWVRPGGVRQAETNGQPAIWVHAVSVGEVLAVSRMIAELDAALPEYRVLISTTTRTGQALARERFGRERVFYSPLDLPWAVRARLEALKPAMLVLAETEFWPNLLHGCYRRDIPVAVVNARISNRSWPRYKALKRLWKPFLGRLSAVLAQSELDAERLRALGCAPERVTVAGNLKFDARSSRESDATKLIQETSAGLRLLVAGSTLEGEEEALLAAWPALLAAQPEMAMVLAPRHPERFDTVADLLSRSGFPWRLRSKPGRDGIDEKALAPGEIILLNSMGELASVYSLAAAAFVGGSLAPAGGHNPLEPAQFGVPVVMGDHYENFQAIVNEMLEEEALRIARPMELEECLIALLKDRQAAAAMGERGRKVFEKRGGATARTVAVLKEILSKRNNP